MFHESHLVNSCNVSSKFLPPFSKQAFPLLNIHPHFKNWNLKDPLILTSFYIAVCKTQLESLFFLSNFYSESLTSRHCQEPHLIDTFQVSFSSFLYSTHCHLICSLLSIFSIVSILPHNPTVIPKPQILVICFYCSPL